MALKDDRRGVLPEDLVREIPSGFQVIGDVAVLFLPPRFHEFRVLVARAVLSRHRNVRTVVNRIPIPRGDLRVADMEVLIGDHTITVCREYGFCYRLDVARTFYTSRLASERHRVWMQVMPGEEVLVPFAGVGPFVIPPASRGARVTAVEKNPESCRFLRENVILNRVEPDVIVHDGELEKILPTLPSGVDRAIIPAPYGYDQVLFFLLPLVRPGGVIHFYTFKRASQVPALEREYRRAGLRVEYTGRCGYVAPGVARYVFDMVKGDDSTSP